ncbi:MAG: Spy/CpxP family protein refolding chaperone [Rectinema subterraneum]|uniref:Spy/CpxP family protein refolding chaperone n=1 Tax=Rectinema subterraneum TaxID=2653714 RepID=UPI003C7A4913
MRTSRKAIVFLMVGAMLVAVTAGAFAQGFGRMGGPGVAVPGYGFNRATPVAPSYGYGARGWATVPGTAVPRKWNNKSFNPSLGFMGRMGMMGSSGYGALHYFQYQKLSTEDKAKVDKLVQDTAEQILPLQNELRSLKLALNGYVWDTNPDKAKIDETIAKIADLQKKIQELRTNSILEINKIFQTAQ